MNQSYKAGSSHVFQARKMIKKFSSKINFNEKKLVYRNKICNRKKVGQNNILLKRTEDAAS